MAGNLTLEPGRHEARVGDTSLALTPTEFRLLEALVRADGDIVPHLQLARAGWPAETDPDLLWLKPHLARLRAKVQAAGGPLVVAVRGVGYRVLVPDDVPPDRGRAARPRPPGHDDAAPSGAAFTFVAFGVPVGSAFEHARWSDGDADRSAVAVVDGVGAGDPATAGVAPTERIEMRIRVVAHRRAGDSRTPRT